jgi:hypothetical protein
VGLVFSGIIVLDPEAADSNWKWHLLEPAAHMYVVA